MELAQPKLPFELKLQLRLWLHHGTPDPTETGTMTVRAVSCSSKPDRLSVYRSSVAAHFATDMNGVRVGAATGGRISSHAIG